jgi:hypothetical protein
MIFYHIAVMDHSPSPVEDICHLAMEMNVYIQTTSYSLVSNQYTIEEPSDVFTTFP